jgi:hypothetical protein
MLIPQGTAISEFDLPRASRYRLDVQSLNALTWDNLADVDGYLGEAVELLRGLMKELEK